MHEGVSQKLYSILCLECACQMRSFINVEEAAKEWNRRAYPGGFTMTSPGNFVLHAEKIESKSDIIEWS